MRNRDKFFKNVDPARSYVMSKIRSKNTSLEKTLGRLLKKEGYSFKRNYKKLPGTPDFVFLKVRVALFCDSSFWHGRNFKEKSKRIKTNRAYWLDKIRSNIARDKLVSRKLRSMGWAVLRIWDDAIIKQPESVMRKIQKKVRERYGKTQGI